MTSFRNYRLAAVGAIASVCTLLAGCPSNGSTAAVGSNQIASTPSGGTTSTPTPSTGGTKTTATPTPSTGGTKSTPTPATSALPPGTLSVTLSWTAPVLNTNGTIVNDLAGYHIHYGKSASAMNRMVDIYGAATKTGKVASLTHGTYYFAVSAYTSAGTESAPSATVSKTI